MPELEHGLAVQRETLLGHAQTLWQLLLIAVNRRVVEDSDWIKQERVSLERLTSRWPVAVPHDIAYES